MKILWAESVQKNYQRDLESNVKSNLVQYLVYSARKDFEQVKLAANPAHAAYLQREAERKLEQAERLLAQFGKPVSPGGTVSPETNADSGRRIKTPLPSLDSEWEKSRSRLQSAAVESDPGLIATRVIREFGAGRAGAGGVALYRAAELVDGPGGQLDVSQITGVDFSGAEGQLVLKDRRIALPPLDPEYVALAIRMVYGKEGAVQGILTADESNAVVVQTGRQQFGEVVWKKEFLAGGWNPVTPGNTVIVELAPGLGLLNAPEPSVNRVTYYGPIRNTRMGQVLLSADQLMTTLMIGLDPNTGLPASIPEIPGYMSILERQVRSIQERGKVTASSSADATSEESVPVKERWWNDIVWLVWVPDQFSLSLTQNGDRLEVLEHRLKLDVWSVTPNAVTSEFRQMSEHFSQHYSEYLKAFPELQDLEHAALAVAVVRWLQAGNIPVDMEWARTVKVIEVETPDTVRRYQNRMMWRDGLPHVEKGEAP